MEQKTRIEKTAKFDPSFKSKRYRDKIRTAIKELETLLPVDRNTVHRKLDSQTVFRLTIAHFRTKLFLQAAGFSPFPVYDIEQQPTADCCLQYDVISGNQYVTTVSSSHVTPLHSGFTTGNVLETGCCEAMMTSSCNWQQQQQQQQQLQVSAIEEELIDGQDSIEGFGGFLLIVTSDGTILYVSNNILQHLGFNQVDLMLRCIYGIVHPDDHQELKIVLENTLPDHSLPQTIISHQVSNSSCYPDSGAICRMVSFLCRIKCFNGTTAGYMKMHCMGHMRYFPQVIKSHRTSNQVLFAFCRPFVSLSVDHVTSNNSVTSRSNSFWTKHDLDLSFRQVDDGIDQVLGFSKEQLLYKSFYSLVHPEDLPVVSCCHRALLDNEDVQTTYFRLQHQNGDWVWLHTRCKVITKNCKKTAILCTHCPVRCEDSTYIQQEAVIRQQCVFQQLLQGNQLTTNDSTSRSTTPAGKTLPPPAPSNPYGGLRDDAGNAVSLHDPHGFCPSSWHAMTDRHSPVFPVTPSNSSIDLSNYQQGTFTDRTMSRDVYLQNYNSDVIIQPEVECFPSPVPTLSSRQFYHPPTVDNCDYYSLQHLPNRKSVLSNNVGMVSPYQYEQLAPVSRDRYCAVDCDCLPVGPTYNCYTNNNYFITCNINDNYSPLGSAASVTQTGSRIVSTQSTFSDMHGSYGCNETRSCGDRSPSRNFVPVHWLQGPETVCAVRPTEPEVLNVTEHYDLMTSLPACGQLVVQR